MKICIQMLDATCGKGTAAAHKTMNKVSFFEQQFSQETAVLTCDTGNERRLDMAVI